EGAGDNRPDGDHACVHQDTLVEATGRGDAATFADTAKDQGVSADYVTTHRQGLLDRQRLLVLGELAAAAVGGAPEALAGHRVDSPPGRGQQIVHAAFRHDDGIATP